jgi:hypothetical protein
MSVADEELICSVLRGEAPGWPLTIADPAALDAFHALAGLHGAQALLHSHLLSSDWPIAILQRLRHEALQLAMWEMRHQQLLTETLGELAAAGIRPVLIKGTALAYSLYPNPVLRTRADTDLLIAVTDRSRIQQALEHLGYARSSGVSGEFVNYQANYSREIDGAVHSLDVHWKINNSEVLAKLFTYEELLAQAEPLSALCPEAMGPSRVHALLLACMHRGTHRQNPYYVDHEAHHEPDRLIWLYDIHLLGEGLSAFEWDEFTRLARQKSLCAICLDGIQRARSCFHTRCPEAVMAALAGTVQHEAPTRYLNGSKLTQQCMDFWALDNWRTRMQFARELFFPSRDYMRGKYPQYPVAPLPWLYLRRACSGIVKIIRQLVASRGLRNT